MPKIEPPLAQKRTGACFNLKIRGISKQNAHDIKVDKPAIKLFWTWQEPIISAAGIIEENLPSFPPSQSCPPGTFVLQTMTVIFSVDPSLSITYKVKENSRNPDGQRP